MNLVFQDRIDELQVELFDTEKAMNVTAIPTIVAPDLETRMGSVPAVPQVMQSSI